MGTSIRPALPFTGTSSVSSTSSVSTDTHATPPNGACMVNAAFSPGRNGSARRSILNVVSLTTGSWAGCFTGHSGFIADHRRFDFCGVDRNDVTASLGCWENKFGRRFRFLRCDFRELVGVTIAINKRRDLFFDRLCGDVKEVGANKNAILFLVLGIERVDIDFYSACAEAPAASVTCSSARTPRRVSVAKSVAVSPPLRVCPSIEVTSARQITFVRPTAGLSLNGDSHAIVAKPCASSCVSPSIVLMSSLSTSRRGPTSE